MERRDQAAEERLDTASRGGTGLSVATISSLLMIRDDSWPSVCRWHLLGSLLNGGDPSRRTQVRGLLGVRAGSASSTSGGSQGFALLALALTDEFCGEKKSLD